VSKDMEEASVLNAFFTSLFTGKISLQADARALRPAEDWSSEGLSSVEEDLVRKHLN